ncbi:MAG: hypothetical protein HKN47_15445, partial [Pirellulaceae bacterium]|nr:hypothetical protein [Pirellulaceae bacterium]
VKPAQEKPAQEQSGHGEIAAGQEKPAPQITKFPTIQPPTSRPVEKKRSRQLTAEQTDEALQWIESLASSEFAKRELAADNLLNIGAPVVPLLRESLQRTDDPEVQVRSKALIAQLKDGDFEARIAAFSDGHDIDFEGWPVFRIIFGESSKSRDIFIQLLRDYPELIESFQGKPRDRAIAMQSVMGKLIDNKLRRPPAELTVADAVALLLPVSDEQVPLTEGYERQMMMVLRMAPANRAPKDPKIGPAFQGLVNAWVSRSTLGNRESVFNFALQADLYTAYPLAIKTLEETDHPQVLVNAMQVIARFGREEDTPLIARYLDDKRALSVLMFQRGVQSRTELGDAAMATIAILHGTRLVDLGFPATAEHKKLGFIYEDLVYSIEDEEKGTAKEQRAAARAIVEQLIKHGVVKPPEKEES